MTTRVWSDVPDAIFVNAHAASNCIKDKDKFQLNTSTMYEMCIDQIRENISKLPHIGVKERGWGPPVAGGSPLEEENLQIGAQHLQLLPPQLGGSVLHSRFTRWHSNVCITIWKPVTAISAYQKSKEINHTYGK
jgi:hypothetical protein